MLLDTSGLFCLHHRPENLHREAVAAYRSATTLVVHSYVLAEFVALADKRGLQRKPALEFVEQLANSPEDIEMVWVDHVLHNEAMQLLMQRLDKRYSFCDAVSFVVMRRRRITDALSTDHHFDQEGFVRLLK